MSSDCIVKMGSPWLPKQPGAWFKETNPHYFSSENIINQEILVDRWGVTNHRITGIWSEANLGEREVMGKGWCWAAFLRITGDCISRFDAVLQWKMIFIKKSFRAVCALFSWASGTLQSLLVGTGYCSDRYPGCKLVYGCLWALPYDPCNKYVGLRNSGFFPEFLYVLFSYLLNYNAGNNKECFYLHLLKSLVIQFMLLGLGSCTSMNILMC